jgi:hypothetical protein
MREPHHYVCGARKQHCVVWYENGKRMRRTFSDANRAEVFYQQKFLGAVDKTDLILNGVTTIRNYIAGGRLAELEAKNAELSAKVEALTPSVSNAPTANVRLFRTDLAKELGVVAATIFHQLSYMYKNPKLGKVLGDGKKYIFNTYREWKENHFPFWSVPTLERAFKLLEDQKRIISKQPDGRRSRRKYYRPLSESIKLMDSGGNEASICEIGTHQIEPLKASICELPLKTKRTKRESADVGEFKAAVMSAAATATDFFDLIKKLQLLFPDHNVPQEYDGFCNWRDQRGLRKVPSKFAAWMLRAEKPLKAPTPTAEIEPQGFSIWFAEEYPNMTQPEWDQAPGWMKDEFRLSQKNGVRAP